MKRKVLLLQLMSPKREALLVLRGRFFCDGFFVGASMSMGEEEGASAAAGVTEMWSPSCTSRSFLLRWLVVWASLLWNRFYGAARRKKVELQGSLFFVVLCATRCDYCERVMCRG